MAENVLKIIGWIALGIGAVLELIAFVFEAKLLDKRAEGLDRRQAEIEKREALLEQPVQFESTRMRPERYQCVTILRPGEETKEDIRRYKEKMMLRLLQDAMEHIVFYRKKDDRHLYAEIWICRKETEAKVHGL